MITGAVTSNGGKGGDTTYAEPESTDKNYPPLK
ncbi:hypothetical protein TFLX_04802 [Thermoflexales bacterium]|nr:hypothetical protein TFLX_04802 [Thermoflexales bacterium]